MATKAIGRAIASPRRRSFSEAVPNCLTDEHVAADEHLGRVEVAGDIGDLMGERDFGLLVEAAGDGDDGEGGATVAGAEGIGAGRPRVGDGDDAVDRGDRGRVRQRGTRRRRGRRRRCRRR